MVKSLGLVLQYSYTGQGRRLDLADANLGRAIAGSVLREREELYIPRARADRFGAGVIRGEPGLGMPDITIGTQLEIVTALRILDSSGQSASALKAIRKENSDFEFRIGDIVAMTSGMVRLEGTDRVQVPAPSDNVRGFTTTRRGRLAFRLCLSRFVKDPDIPATKHSENVLEACNTLIELDNTLQPALTIESSIATLGPTRDVKYLDAVHTLFTAQNAYLEGCLRGKSSFSYLSLVGSHIRLAIFRLGLIYPGSQGETDPEKELEADYMADMEGYSKRLPRIAEELCRQNLASNPAEAVDAWMSMMLRACCWGACHSFVPGERVPIEYYGSQLPVYIG